MASVKFFVALACVQVKLFPMELAIRMGSFIFSLSWRLLRLSTSIGQRLDQRRSPGYPTKSPNTNNLPHISVLALRICAVTNQSFYIVYCLNRIKLISLLNILRCVWTTWNKKRFAPYVKLTMIEKIISKIGSMTTCGKQLIF